MAIARAAGPHWYSFCGKKGTCVSSTSRGTLAGQAVRRPTVCGISMPQPASSSTAAHDVSHRAMLRNREARTCIRPLLADRVVPDQRRDDDDRHPGPGAHVAADRRGLDVLRERVHFLV